MNDKKKANFVKILVRPHLIYTATYFLSTYGDNVGVQYAESILNFSRNCDYAMFIVDHLLDILTGNEHRKTSHYIAEQKMLRREDELLENTYTDLEEIEQSQSNSDLVS